MVSIKNVKQSHKKGFSRVEFDLTGSDINYVVVNTIRRTILTDIPIYAFTQFKFNKNTSVFHNNFLKLQISNMPVWGIDNKINFYEKTDNKTEINEDMEELVDNVELGVDKKVDTTSLEQLTMYVDYHNKSKEIYTVSTDDAKFYFAQKQIENPYKTAIPLVKLQPNQEINFSAISSIGVEKESSIFSPCSICVYEQKDDNTFRFILESRGQITEKKIFKVGFLNIEQKLTNLLKQIPENNEMSGEIQINNEDHTIGNLISKGLQEHKNVDFAGYYQPHPLEKRVMISYKLASGTFKKIVSGIVENYIELFSNIDKLIEKNIS
jgi:DNA-directed RNA polymerase subunit L